MTISYQMSVLRTSTWHTIDIHVSLKANSAPSRAIPKQKNIVKLDIVKEGYGRQFKLNIKY